MNFDPDATSMELEDNFNEGSQYSQCTLNASSGILNEDGLLIHEERSDSESDEDEDNEKEEKEQRRIPLIARPGAVDYKEKLVFGAKRPRLSDKDFERQLLDSDEEDDDTPVKQIVFVNASEDDTTASSEDEEAVSVSPISVSEEAPAEKLAEVNLRNEEQQREIVEGGELQDDPQESTAAGSLEPEYIAPKYNQIIPEPTKTEVKLTVEGFDKPIKCRVLIGSFLKGGSCKVIYDKTNPHCTRAFNRKVCAGRCLILKRDRESLSMKVQLASKSYVGAIIIITDERPIENFRFFKPRMDQIAPPFGAYLISKEDGDKLLQRFEKGISTDISKFTLDPSRPIDTGRLRIVESFPRLWCPFCEHEQGATTHTVCSCPDSNRYVMTENIGSFEYQDKEKDIKEKTECSFDYGPYRVHRVSSPEVAQMFAHRLYPVGFTVPKVPFRTFEQVVTPPPQRLERALEISRICDEICVGPGRFAADREALKKAGIRAVFDCAAQYNQRYNVKGVCKELCIAYEGIPALDAPDYPLLENHYEHFCRVISRWKRDILVVCAEGVNRSCTLTAAYMNQKLNWPLISIVRRMRARRIVALTNPHFRFLLWRFVATEQGPFYDTEKNWANPDLPPEEIPHVPIKKWSLNSIMTLAADLEYLETSAPMYLNMLRRQVPISDNVEGRGNILSSWREGILFGTHEAMMLSPKDKINKVVDRKMFRELLFKTLLSWRLPDDMVRRVSNIWRKNKILSEKSLKKLPKGNSKKLEAIKEEIKEDIEKEEIIEEPQEPVEQKDPEFVPGTIQNPFKPDPWIIKVPPAVPIKVLLDGTEENTEDQTFENIFEGPLPDPRKKKYRFDGRGTPSLLENISLVTQKKRKLGIKLKVKIKKEKSIQNPKNPSPILIPGVISRTQCGTTGNETVTAFQERVPMEYTNPGFVNPFAARQQPKPGIPKKIPLLPGFHPAANPFNGQLRSRVVSVDTMIGSNKRPAPPMSSAGQTKRPPPPSSGASMLDRLRAESKILQDANNENESVPIHAESRDIAGRRRDAHRRQLEQKLRDSVAEKKRQAEIRKNMLFGLEPSGEVKGQEDNKVSSVLAALEAAEEKEEKKNSQSGSDATVSSSATEPKIYKHLDFKPRKEVKKDRKKEKTYRHTDGRPLTEKEVLRYKERKAQKEALLKKQNKKLDGPVPNINSGSPRKDEVRGNEQNEKVETAIPHRTVPLLEKKHEITGGQNIQKEGSMGGQSTLDKTVTSDNILKSKLAMLEAAEEEEEALASESRKRGGLIQDDSNPVKRMRSDPRVAGRVDPRIAGRSDPRLA